MSACLLVCLHFCSDRSRLGNQAHFEDKLVQNWGGPLDHFLIGPESNIFGFGRERILINSPSVGTLVAFFGSWTSGATWIAEARVCVSATVAWGEWSAVVAPRHFFLKRVPGVVFAQYVSKNVAPCKLFWLNGCGGLCPLRWTFLWV